MKRYSVIVTVDATVSTVVEVEADSPEEADERALEIARTRGSSLAWELNDGNLNGEPYLGDPGAAEGVES